MNYIVEIEERGIRAEIKFKTTQNSTNGSLYLSAGEFNKYTGAFELQELEMCQNSKCTTPDSSYVHNVYIEKRESGAIYKSKKREDEITLIPCIKLYLNESLYYGYEICMPGREVVIPIYKRKENATKRYDEYQVGLIKKEPDTGQKKMYHIFIEDEDKLAGAIMLLYCYMTSMLKFESDLKITVDKNVLKKHRKEFLEKLGK